MQNLKDYYIKSLQDGRNVWLYGQKVDVTTDKHFAGTLSTISNLFSLFDDPIRRDSIGYVSPKTKEFVHTAFLIPNSYNELLMRRTAFETWVMLQTV